MKKVLSALLFCLLAFICTAQTDVPSCLFYGYVEEGQFVDESVSKRKKEKEPQKLSEVKIFIYVGDQLQSEQLARETGFYALLLGAGQKYRVVFEKDGYFCKCFELDCREVNFPSNDAALKCLADVSLFKKVEDDNLLNLCKYPFARCAYNTSDREMVWDMEYTERTKQKFYQLAQPYYLAEKK